MSNIYAPNCYPDPSGSITGAEEYRAGAATAGVNVAPDGFRGWVGVKVLEGEVTRTVHAALDTTSELQAIYSDDIDVGKPGQLTDVQRLTHTSVYAWIVGSR